MKRMACGVIVAALLAGCTQDQALTRFRANLAEQDSATVALEHWCAARAIATPAHIEAATQDDAAATPATAAIRAALEVGPDESVRVRHVLLSCGGIVLSDARNWYVPARLTPDMNRTLDATRVPFGKVVAPIGLHRRVWTGRSPASCPAGTIQHNTAVLRRDDGMPYSLVSECYTRANIAPQRA
jgi:chorismate-pyruvate lyase